VSTSAGKKDFKGKSMFAPDVINQQSSMIAIAVNSLQSTQPASISGTTMRAFGGGAVSASAPDSMLQLCWDYYSNPEAIDINLFIDTTQSETVKAYLNTICQDTRKDAMCVLNVPKAKCVNTTQEAAKIVDWRNDTGAGLGNINSSYAAVYGNWGKIYDRYNDKYRWIPLAGHVAGIYAYTDEVTDPWFAPAGLNRGLLSTDIIQLGFNPTLGDRDLLYKSNINPLTEFRGKGIPIWGQKTMSSRPSSFDRVNVRRLFLVLEKAIATMAQYYLFEPNDRLTRSRFVSTVEPYLEDIKGRRGIYDFMVIADESNNTPTVIDRNEFVADILIKPTRAAEFIVLNFVALSTGASFTEYTSA
jgi:phage tail sheath protein FI